RLYLVAIGIEMTSPRYRRTCGSAQAGAATIRSPGCIPARTSAAAAFQLAAVGARDGAISAWAVSKVASRTTPTPRTMPAVVPRRARAFTRDAPSATVGSGGTVGRSLSQFAAERRSSRRVVIGLTDLDGGDPQRVVAVRPRGGGHRQALAPPVKPGDHAVVA